MQRFKDYAGFGVWFLGLGYIVMWGLTGLLGPDLRPPALPPMFHLIGLLAAITVFVRLLLIALRSTRKPQGEGAASRPVRRMRRPEPTVKRIKVRDHFGLRGLQR